MILGSAYIVFCTDPGNFSADDEQAAYLLVRRWSSAIVTKRPPVMDRLAVFLGLVSSVGRWHTRVLSDSGLGPLVSFK